MSHERSGRPPPGSSLVGSRTPAAGGPGKRTLADSRGRPPAGRAHAVATGGGQPLPPDVQATMEQGFNADLSGVRIHPESARPGAMGAVAYAQGADIHFAPGQYDPDSTRGRELLGHELAHVVQQARGGIGTADSKLNHDDGLETSADELGARAARGEDASSGASEVAPPSAGDDAPIQLKKENEGPLADIQGKWMVPLLAAIEGLAPEVAHDFDAAGVVSGPRLVTAMKVVAARRQGQNWLAAAHALSADIGALPADQIGEIMTYLGAPKGAKLMKAAQLGGQFDATVDPAGSIVMIFRVKFAVAPARFGGVAPGTPAWEAETKKAIAAFAPGFERTVENTWKGTIKPSTPVGPIKQFKFSVDVQTVTSGEHKLVYLHPDTDPDGRSNMSKKPDENGNLKVDANDEKSHTANVSDAKGRLAGQVTTKQRPSAHEFGHAIGLDHVNGPGDTPKDYGVTAEQRDSVMGAGSQLKVIERGGTIVHNDFEPFIRIATAWGKDVFPGAIAKVNKWSGTQG